VQLFFARRVYKCTGYRYIAFFIGLVAISAFAGTIWTSVAVYDTSVLKRPKSSRYGIGMWATGSILADGLITGTLVLHLSIIRVGWGKTEDVIGRINRLTIQTCAITTVCALIFAQVYLLCQCEDSGIAVTVTIAIIVLFIYFLFST